MLRYLPACLPACLPAGSTAYLCDSPQSLLPVCIERFSAEQLDSVSAGMVDLGRSRTR